MTKWGWRVPSASFLTTLAAASLTWVAVIPGPTQILAAIGAAVVTVGGPFWVSSVHERRVARERAVVMRELPSANSSAGLLRADRRIVPFTGRDTELADLLDWCSGDRGPRVRLLVGAGGVGKTRLALELGDRLETNGWQVAVVAAGQEADAFTILHATRRSSILLIVDYAETRTGLVELLRSVAGSSAHVRVLLIARSTGDWWRRLRSDVPAVQDLVTAYRPLELSAQMDAAISPTELIHEAVRSFAEELGVPVPTGAAATPPAGEAPVLALHAAALLTVLRSRDRPTPPGPSMASVLSELLRHERRFWEHSAEQAKLDLDSVVLQRAVAVACLFGAVDESDGAKVLHRVPDLREDENRRRRSVARWLHQLYPGGPDYWGVLQPELVAETHVIEQLTECPELVMADLSGLHIEQKLRMLRVLSMGAAHHPAGMEQLEHVLRADIERLVPLALEVAE